MKDYFSDDFDFENEDFNMDDFMKYFVEKYNCKDDFNKPMEEYLEGDIDNLSEEGFEMEELFNEDSKFREIMNKLEVLRFEKMMDENYNNLKNNGLNVFELKQQRPEDVARVIETINIMQETFLAREEYEKCAVLRPILNTIEKEIQL
tara:strand:+ start:7523 stop:7966 length:444 start_codon:yes stop_codon:yes gene_type:complete